MNVLHVSAGNLFGGVEVVLNTLARERALCPAMEPGFALCFDGRSADDLAAAGVRVGRLGAVQARFPWQVWRARRRFGALLQSERPDVVVCHLPWSLAIFGPVARRSGRPLAFWMHDVAAGEHWVERWAGRCVPDLAICNSYFTVGTLPKLFPCNLPPTEVLRYPVLNQAAWPDLVAREALRAEFDTPADACVIVQVGRMERYKGHEQHLDALARLMAMPGWVCWIVGGAQRPHEMAYLVALKERAARGGIADRVRFLGERRDVGRLLGAADIFCQPNLSPEPFGIVYIEALYAGLPVVGTAFGGAVEIIDDTCGRLVPPASPDALAGVLRELVASPALRGDLGRAGPSRAEFLCDPGRALASLADCLAKLRSSHKTGATFAR